MIVSTAPGRCGIVGNPSDIYGGSVISITTRERARCALVCPLDVQVVADGRPLLLVPSSGYIAIAGGGRSAVLRSTDDMMLRGDELDIPRAALSWFGIVPSKCRFSLEVSTDIPMQAGMAGSTALIVAIVGALDSHFGWRLHPWAIAEAARKIESRVMGVVCGLQDQHMAAFGGLNYMDFAGKEKLQQRDDEPLATIESLVPYAPRVPLLLAHTGIKHHSGTVHRSPRERWLAGEPLVVESYLRIAELARLGKRALLEGDWPKLGRLMNENHAIVANLGGSGPANERLIEAARTAGAYGAKLAGAGGGGTIIALTDDSDRVGAALMAAGADSLMIPEPSRGLTVSQEEVC